MGAILCCFDECLDENVDNNQTDKNNEEKIESIHLQQKNNTENDYIPQNTRQKQVSSSEDVDLSNEFNYKVSRAINANHVKNSHRNEARRRNIRTTHRSNQNRTRIDTNSPKVCLKVHLLTILKANPYNWVPMNEKDVFIYVNLNNSNHEFLTIKNKFINSADNESIRVLTIDRVQNPYITGRYLLKKMQMKAISKVEPQEYDMFHGVKDRFVDSICKNNFNWRFSRPVSEDLFSKGVHFSPVSSHAIKYCDRNNFVKIVMVAKVLVGNIYAGSVNLPWFSDSMNDIRYDSAVRENSPVIVKIFDDEFYPAYKIRFVEKFIDKNCKL